MDKGKTALLLEDSVERGEPYVALLKELGYTVVWVRSFQEVTRAWEGHVFKVALLDHDLGPVEYFGSGSMFTRWLLGETVNGAPVMDTLFIVHSANTCDTPGMMIDLGRAGYEAIRTDPSGVEKLLREMVAPKVGGKEEAQT